MQYAWARKALVFSLVVVGAAATVVATVPWPGAMPMFSKEIGAAFASAAPDAATVTLTPQDTYLNLDSVNYSTAPLLATYTWPDAKVANAAVMKFDLSSLPAGAAIQEATLHLALVESDGVADTYAVSAHKITGRTPVINQATGLLASTSTPWTPSTCCNNNTPLAQADISTPYDTQMIDTAPGFKVWTITRLVQEWAADPASNRGMLLNSDTAKPRDRYRFFASMENPTATLRPYLRVTYAAGDVTAPTVAISSPGSGATISGNVTVLATASDNVGVAGVRLTVDGKAIGSELSTSPYGLTLDTTALADGPHTFSAIARDAAGNTNTAAGVTATVLNGILVLAPQDTYLNLDTAAHSTEALLGTYTWPDNKPANAILMKFDLSAVPKGVFIKEATLNLALVQSDSVADTYAIRAQKVVGMNPDIAKATGATADGAKGWTANPCCSNNVPLAQADLSTPYDTQSISTGTGWKTWTVTGMAQEWLTDPASNFGVVLNADALKPRDRYRFFASMENADVTLRPYLRLTYAAGEGDGQMPSVSVTAPTGNQSVSGMVAMAASASDNVGVTGVQFRVDGNNVGAEITSAPYSAMWNSDNAATGQHTITAVARDAAGNTRVSAGVAVSVTRDTTLPSVSITAPSPRVTQTGVISLKANASDNVGVVGVQFTIDGVNVGEEDTEAPYSVSWNSAEVTNASHALRAIARDAAGNTRTSSSVSVRTSNDRTLPTVSVTAPSAGATLMTSTALRASASDNVGVSGVQFLVDGVKVGAEDTSSPYSITWNPTSVSPGTHAITAVARDAAGNTRTSSAISVSVIAPPPPDTTAPVISSVAATGMSTSGANITWTTNEASDSQVEYGLTTNYSGSTSVASSLVTSHVVAVGGLSAGTTYHARVRSKDPAGNLAVSGDITFTTSSVPPPPSGGTGGLAAQFPGDVNIETHPDVVFVERFDEASTSALFSRWNDVLNGTAMTIGTDAPSGGNGRSLTIPWQGGGANNGGHLYRQLPAITDTLYVRYYIKYPTTGLYQHSGVWMGGANPANTWPNPQAGIKPAGNDRFSAAAEQDAATGRFDHYDYWMGMHQSSDGNYWGDKLLNSSLSIQTGQWVCVEQMVKLNNPVSSTNGEHAIWLNGTKVSHVGQGFPNGSWSGGIFTQSASGTPFPGIQWRNDANLNINWLWLQTYAPNDPAGFQGTMKFAQLVAAKSYIGCMGSTPPPPPPPAGDTTPPTVSISSPAASATVSGSVAVSATASDNVGVAGVQFKLDGANLGSEDTSSPYSVSWTTTSTANGSHVLTAVARDAAGNVTTSASRTVTVSNNTGGGGGGGTGNAVFESNWDTATGNSSAAVSDGGKWPNYWEFNGGNGTQLLSVVSGGPNGHNALRVLQKGSTQAANVQIDNVVPQSTDYYLRFYMKNDDTSGSGDHIVTVDTYEYANLTFLRKSSSASGWNFVVSLYGCGYTYPIGHWGPQMNLARGQWYRFEYFVDFVDATHIQLHPRVYDANGTLVLSDADFKQSDFGNQVWNGRNDWSLASYYAAGNSFCVNPSFVNDIGLGNNGQQGATNTGQYWYFAGVQVRTDGWPGAISAAAPAPASSELAAANPLDDSSSNPTGSTSTADAPFAWVTAAGSEAVRRRRVARGRRGSSRRSSMNPSAR